MTENAATMDNSGNVKSLNVAAGNITIEKQVWIDKSRQSPSDQHPIPTHSSAAYINNYYLPQHQQADVVWNDSIREFVSQENRIKVIKARERAWNGPLHWLNHLEKATTEFRQRLWQKGESCHDRSTRQQQSWPEAINPEDELKTAIRLYEKDRLRHTNILKNLLELKNNSPCFLRWIKDLPIDKHRYPLYNGYYIILKAITDHRKLNSLVFESLANVTGMLESSKKYTALHSAKRLPLHIEEKSMELLGIIAQWIIKLLDCASKAISEKQRDLLNEITKRIQYTLTDLNTQSRNDARFFRQRQPDFDPDIHYDLPLIFTLMDLLLKSTQVQQSSIIDCPSVGTERWADDSEYTYGRAGKRRSTSHAPSPTHKRQRRQVSRLRESSASTHEAMPIFMVSDLVNCISWDDQTSIRHLDKALSPADIEETHARQITALTNRDTFQSWLMEQSNSSALLIQGNFGHTGILSPLSYLCARIAQAHTGVSQISVLSYFCSLRVKDHDPRANAAGLVSEIIGQLVTHPKFAFHFDLQFVNPRMIKKIKNDDLKSLVRLFLDLVHQLHREPVVIFLLIDSISVYENRRLHAETEILLSTLQELAGSYGVARKKKSTKLIFKFLITDAGSTQYAYRYFQPDQIMNMSEDLDEGYEGELNL